MKRLFSLFLVLAMAFSLTGCLSREEQEDRKQALQMLNGTSKKTYAMSTGTSLEGQVIYEDDSDLMVYLAGIRGTPRQPELVLAVKNGTRQDLSMAVTSLTYDGWDADGWVTTFDFDSHSASTSVLSCSPEFAELNLDDLHKVRLSLEIYTSDSYETVAYVDASADLSSSTEVIPYVPQGLLLMDSHGVQVYAQSIDTLDGDSVVNFYLKNSSGGTVRLSTDKASLNDEPVLFLLWTTVSARGQRIIKEDILVENEENPLTLFPEDRLSFLLQLSDEESGTILDEVAITLRPADFQL